MTDGRAGHNTNAVAQLKSRNFTEGIGHGEHGALRVVRGVLHQ
jgi:hypothetical protein